MRRALAGAAVAALAVVCAQPVLADWIDQLPQPTPEAVASSVRAFQPQTRGFSPSVRDLRPRVREIVQQRTEGTTKVIDLNTDLLFEFAKADVNADAAAKVTELIRPIPNGVTVQVYGHTDGIGSDAANLKLSQDRANAVAGILRQGRPDLKLDVQGFGKTKPLAPEGGENDAEARAQNRRVEVRYQG